MKGMYLIAIALLVSCTAIVAQEEPPEIPTKCPAVDSENATHIAHETDCTKFYKCHMGKKYLKQCPVMNDNGDRLYFNARLQVCDWPWHSGCKPKGHSDEAEVENEPLALDEENQSLSDMADIPTKCPAVDPENATHIAHETDCTKFYKCHMGKKYLKQCPVMNDNGDRLYFNARLQVCDWPWHSGCKPKSHSDEKQVEEELVQDEEDEEAPLAKIPTKCPRIDPKNTTIHLAHESDCTKFYMCHMGKKILKKCPYMNKKGDRLHFNPRLQVCDWPWSAGCKNYSPTPNPTGSSTRNPGDDCDDGELRPHECKCSLFYECQDGQLVLRECPNNKYFSEKWNGCTKAEDSECVRRKRYRCRKEGDLIPHECDCSKYYKCRGDDQILMKCKGDLHFSPKRRRCEEKDKAGCDEKEPIPREPGDCPDPEPENPWRHKCDCRLFYKCEDGKMRLYECPWGFYYDEQKHICADREKVNCRNKWKD